MPFEKVKVYDCKVRHGGNVEHTIPKQAVTDRELRVLKHVHGDDAVVDVREAGERDINTDVELYELAVRYSRTSNPRWGRELVERVFGVKLAEGFARWMAEREELREMEASEALSRRQLEAARFAAAREAAEARVRAEMAAEQSRAQPQQPEAQAA